MPFKNSIGCQGQPFVLKEGVFFIFFFKWKTLTSNRLGVRIRKICFSKPNHPNVSVPRHRTHRRDETWWDEVGLWEGRIYRGCKLNKWTKPEELFAGLGLEHVKGETCKESIKTWITQVGSLSGVREKSEPSTNIHAEGSCGKKTTFFPQKEEMSDCSLGLWKSLDANSHPSSVAIHEGNTMGFSGVQVF